jgi:hypothetical protein
MASTARRTDPELWEQVKRRVTRGDKGGAPGTWSARKAQLAVAEYKKAGGGYVGPKAADNSLARWTREAWGTASGRPSGESGERYLPKAARARLTTSEHDRTTAKKRADTRAGRHVSAQPPDVARKVAAARKGSAAPAATADGVARQAPRRPAKPRKTAATARGAAGGSAR